jgi:23S rRNA U2552 (ribose-2'-O)-methylase RlmE/FtsJ
MESVSRESVKPWQRLKMFKQSNNTYIFCLESNTCSHTIQEEEATLHEYRNRINEYESVLPITKNWEYYKKVVNPYELIYTQKKYDNFPESVCFLKPLSRSYFKMIEMLDLIGFYEIPGNDIIKSAHVCEGPGGFIEAVFDAAHKNKKRIQTSIAMTLKSRQTNVPGWKRAAQFLQKNKNIRIIYGEDDTGNIMKANNQQYFIDYCTNPDFGGKVSIFTADGGFDFSYDYEKQEKMIFPLLVASVKIGFEVLKKGGVFILKIFDFYQKFTTDLLYLLSAHFQEWTLYKPATSRPCNPEQYFIGKGFTGCNNEILDVLRLWCNILENDQSLDMLLKNDYNKDFKAIVSSLRKNSFNTQTEYLEKVFFMIDKNDDELIQSYLKKNEVASSEWCIRFRVPIYSERLHSIVGSQTYLPVSFQ